MCQSNHCNHDESPSSEPPKDWLKRLWSILEPLSLFSFFMGGVVYVSHLCGAPVRLDPDYTWVLKGYLLLLCAAFGVVLCAILYRESQHAFPVVRLCIRALLKERKANAISIEICALNDSLEAAREDLSGAAHGTSRAPEVSREIVGLAERMDALADAREALREEIDGIITEIEERTGRKIKQ